MDIVELVKRYIADTVTLMRLEEMAGEKKRTDMKKLKFARSVIGKVISDINVVSYYLETLNPLTGRGEAMKVALYSQISLK